MNWIYFNFISIDHCIRCKSSCHRCQSYI